MKKPNKKKHTKEMKKRVIAWIESLDEIGEVGFDNHYTQEPSDTGSFMRSIPTGGVTIFIHGKHGNKGL